MAKILNSHRVRYVLISAAVLLLIGVVLIWLNLHPFCSETPCPDDGNMTPLEIAVLNAVNVVRTQPSQQVCGTPVANLPVLTAECHATHYAKVNSQMMRRGKEAHKTFCDRGNAIKGDVCDFGGAAEVAVAFPMDFESSNADIAGKAVKAWLCSAKHRAIILSTAYNYAGVAVVKDGADIFWITMFLVKKS